jgi:hypothetical protein
MKKAFKIVLYIVGGLLLLVLLVAGWLMTPSGKGFVRDKAVTFLRNKLKTEVYVGSLDYRLPKMVELKDVLLKDQRNDTLLAVGTLRVEMAMLKLLSNKVEVNKIELSGGVVDIYRIAPDTNFNFTYITKAFAAPPDPNAQDAPTDSSGQLQLDVNELALNNIRVTFDDYTAGNRFAINVDTLYAGINKVDPYNMDFGLNKLYANNVTSTFVVDTSYLEEMVDIDSVAVMPKIAAGELDLNNISFSFTDIYDDFHFSTSIKRLVGHPKTIDLNNEYIAVNDLLLEQSRVKVLMGSNNRSVTTYVADTSAAPKWRIIANSIKLNGVDVAYDDQNKPVQSAGINYSHLNIQNLVLDAKEVWYTTDTIAATINHLSATERSGLNLQKLSTTFAYYPQGLYLRNLYVQTDKTLLRDFAELKYPSVEAFTKAPQQVEMKVNIDRSVVGIKDILLFAPQLRNQPLFRKFGNDRLNLSASVTGRMNALRIAKLQASGLGNTVVDLNGRVNGLPDANKLNYDLNIRRVSSNKALIASLLPATVLRQINPPNTFTISGKLAGNTTTYNTDLLAATSDGNAKIKGTLSMARKGGEKYDMAIRMDKLNIGKIIRKDSLLGRITANVTVKGQGFNPKYMNAMLKGDIVSAGFMGYNYNSIHFNGNIANQQADLDLVSNDPNLAITLDGHASFKNKYPAIVAKLVIDSSDLQALKLSKDEMRIRGVIDANIEELNPDYPRGSVVLNRPTIVYKGERYYLDSMYVTSQPNADSGNYIVINTDAVQAVISGHTPLSQIGNIVQSHIERHYATGKVSIPKSVPANYDLAVKATIVDRPLLHVLLPGLQSMDTLKLQAGLTPGTMFLDANTPRVVYNDMYLYNANARVRGADSALTFGVTLDRFTQNNLEFWYSSINGNVQRQTINARAVIADSSRNERFSLGAAYRLTNDSQYVSVQTPLRLNYKDWAVSTPNAIMIGKDGLYVQNFRISNGGESIAINSENPSFSAPMTIAINDFLIANITEIISKDTLLANGVLNSNLRVQNLMKQPMISGTLGINNLSVLGDTVGNLAADITEASASKAQARVTINGRGNDVALTGYYYPVAVNGNNFDLDLNINAINVRSMEGVAMHQIRNSSGYVRGKVKITGTIAAPKVVGELRTDSLTTTIAALGTAFKMPAEKIRVTQDGLEFQNFRLIDENGNAGTIDGKIITSDFKNMQLALRFDARNFQVVNSTAKDNELFYGKLLISSNLRINGTPAAPIVDGNLTIHDTSKFSIVIPKDEAQIQERDGIVEFVDMRDTNRNKVLVTNVDTVRRFAFRSGADVNVNLTLQKNAEFNIVIDEGTGDFLSIRGEANLNTNVLPDGTVALTGKYELQQGYYELNYNFIKRRFEIQSGSTITFTGDPLNSIVDITAVYTANIPPYDLVEKQVTDPAQLVYYKQRIPFQVKLKLTGEIMKPEIAFDVTLPENKALGVSTDVASLVQAKLSQIRNNPSELNKQVFAVLILNRFVSDNPFESGTGTDAEFIARQSVSRFISEQLNEFAKDLISGVDLTLDLQTSEDYTTGQKRNRTDLNLAASKRLLNDRLTLTVGNNFELEGQNQNRNQNTALIPTNLSADYQLTRDGRYVARLYRKNDNTDILEGYVVETGASFIVTMEYNRFRNLFINRRRQLQKMREAAANGQTVTNR